MGHKQSTAEIASLIRLDNINIGNLLKYLTLHPHFDEIIIEYRQQEAKWRFPPNSVLLTYCI
jgi:hypothetical protein